MTSRRRLLPLPHWAYSVPLICLAVKPEMPDDFLRLIAFMRKDIVGKVRLPDFPVYNVPRTCCMVTQAILFLQPARNRGHILNNVIEEPALRQAGALLRFAVIHLLSGPNRAA